MNKNRILLVDGSGYLFRAYHAMPELTNSAGESTGAIFGVTKMLARIQLDLKPDYIAIVMDAKGKTFRHDMYQAYKANRPPMPDDLRTQLESIKEIIVALGLPLIERTGVEADDVIGTLAWRAQEAGMEVIVSTNDKDMTQLVQPGVTLLNTMDGGILDTEGVIKKFGVPPDQIIDYLALVGDSVDNVPGIPKVGPKTAAKWLNQYKNVEEIIADADAFKGKVGEYLRENLEQLKLSKQLVTIKCDLDVATTVEQLVASSPDIEKLKQLYNRFEFRRMYQDLVEYEIGQTGEGSKTENADISTEQSKTKLKYETILTEEALVNWADSIKEKKCFAVDTETTSLDATQAKLVGISLAVTGRACYIPIAHCAQGDDLTPKQLSVDTIIKHLKPLLESNEIVKVGQNIKYDQIVLSSIDIKINPPIEDTMLQSYVLDSTSRHDMDSLALKYLNHQTIKFEDVAGKGKAQVTFDYISISDAANYAAEDAHVTLQLFQNFDNPLHQAKSLLGLYEGIEIPLVDVLSTMESTGVIVDTERLQQLSQDLSKKLELVEAQAFEIAGKPFNLNSPKQIQQILYTELGLPVIQKTAKGQPSTAESVLKDLASQHELPQLIVEHRGLAKLKSTYSDSLPLQINPLTNRVHTSYHQAVASTGRLSSSDPNLQNIPIRTENGRRVRQAFVSPPNYLLLAADYSQIELRIMAHLANDEKLLSAFAHGADIHSATAAEVFDVKIDDVSTDQRRSAKAINFGLMYGMSAFGLAKQLHITRQEAQEYVDLYFARYRGVSQFMNDIKLKAKEDGFVETMFGRRLYLPNINARNPHLRQGSERVAINAPLQGSAADIIKLAMITIHDWIQHDQPNIKMIMQVHDELVFEILESEITSVQQTIKHKMENAATLKVPLVVDIGIGANWDEAH